MLKKIFKIMIVTMLMFFTIGNVAYAEDNTTSDVQITTYDTTENSVNDSVVEIDEAELMILKDPLGAQVRMLQLQKRVELQIESANIIVEKLTELNESVDELEDLISEFNALLEEIKSETENMADKSAEELAQNYVALKDKAIELSNEFRTVASTLITDEIKAELKNQIKERERANKEVRNEKLEQLKAKFNVQQTKRLMINLGVKNPEDILAQIESGNISGQEIKAKIQERYEKLETAERKQALDKLREETQKRVIESKEIKERLKTQIDANREALRAKIEQRKSLNNEASQMRNADVMKRLKEEGLENITPEMIQAKIREGNYSLEELEDMKLRLGNKK